MPASFLPVEPQTDNPSSTVFQEACCSRLLAADSSTKDFLNRQADWNSRLTRLAWSLVPRCIVQPCDELPETSTPFSHAQLYTTNLDCRCTNSALNELQRALRQGERQIGERERVAQPQYIGELSRTLDNNAIANPASENKNHARMDAYEGSGKNDKPALLSIYTVCSSPPRVARHQPN